MGERDIPHRSIGETFRSDSFFLDEGAVRPEDLDAVVDAITHVDKPVLCRLHTVNGISELPDRRRIRIIGAKVAIIRPVTVGAPEPLELSGLWIDNNNPLVAIPVSNV